MTNALTQGAHQTPFSRDRITARYCAFLVLINVTTTPEAEWIAPRQITEAFPWGGAPRYMIRDSDRIWRRRHTPMVSHGHSGKTDCTGVPVANSF
jgi:hypothetical protein